MEPVLYERIFRLQQTHWWYRSREKFLDRLLRDLPADGMVLDAGCGPGSMLHYFSRYGEVVGIDRYLPALTMCRSHFTGTLIQGECRTLPFADGSFTLVAACEVLYHRNVTDVPETVRELTRVLKPGGVLLVIDSAFAGCQADHDLAAHGIRRFTRKELVVMMHSAGLEIIHSTYAYALLLPVVWLLRRLKTFFGIKGAPGGELHAAWPPLNAAVICWFALEAVVAGRWGLPFGLSVQVLGRKNAHPAP